MVFCDHGGLPLARPSMSRFRPVDRHTSYLLPPSIEDWLPENHLARFIVEVVDGCDLSALEKAYAGAVAPTTRRCCWPC